MDQGVVGWFSRHGPTALVAIATVIGGVSAAFSAKAARQSASASSSAALAAQRSVQLAEMARAGEIRRLRPSYWARVVTELADVEGKGDVAVEVVMRSAGQLYMPAAFFHRGEGNESTLLASLEHPGEARGLVTLRDVSWSRRTTAGVVVAVDRALFTCLETTTGQHWASVLTGSPDDPKILLTGTLWPMEVTPPAPAPAVSDPQPVPRRKWFGRT